LKVNTKRRELLNLNKIIDFFCGGGGMGLGFKNKGFSIVASYDFDKYAIQSYKHNVENHAQQVDISTLTHQDLPHADVWTFGFPCQDVSLAGKRAGMVEGETRSGLFYEVMRLLKETEDNDKELPKIILAENVKGVKSYLKEIQLQFNQRGYKFSVILYNSKYFVPQNRERYFMIGVHNSINKDFAFKEQDKTVIKRLIDYLQSPNEVADKFYIDNSKATEVINNYKKYLIEKNKVESDKIAYDDTYGFAPYRIYDDLSPALRAGRYGLKTIEGELHHVGDIDTNGYDLIKRVYNPEGVSPTLNSCPGGNSQSKVVLPNIKVSHPYRSREFESQGLKDISPALCARDYKDPKNIWCIDNIRVRKLTPREYARLQGFPDTYEQVVSDSQFYKQMGNAVTVNVSEFVAEQIKEFLN
jgi:DNA (cytosine-5)-methyltransferase 1